MVWHHLMRNANVQNKDIAIAIVIQIRSHSSGLLDHPKRQLDLTKHRRASTSLTFPPKVLLPNSPGSRRNIRSPTQYLVPNTIFGPLHNIWSPRWLAWSASLETSLLLISDLPSLCLSDSELLAACYSFMSSLVSTLGLRPIFQGLSHWTWFDSMGPAERWSCIWTQARHESKDNLILQTKEGHEQTRSHHCLSRKHAPRSTHLHQNHEKNVPR